MAETNSNTETQLYDLERYFILYKLCKFVCDFSQTFSKYIPFQTKSLIFYNNESLCILKKTAGRHFGFALTIVAAHDIQNIIFRIFYCKFCIDRQIDHIANYIV